eukprot:GABV01013968.1.p1 GENE.GABV01013968.1~~GABV01013968.1.p1  ORF type:complete len:139 (-),score=44.86 GABV01013968.1:3-419(-)
MEEDDYEFDEAEEAEEEEIGAQENVDPVEVVLVGDSFVVWSLEDVERLHHEFYLFGKSRRLPERDAGRFLLSSAKNPSNSFSDNQNPENTDPPKPPTASKSPPNTAATTVRVPPLFLMGHRSRFWLSKRLDFSRSLDA